MKMKNNLFDAHFKTTISYANYQTKEFDGLHEQILRTGWANNILQFLLDSIFDDATQKLADKIYSERETTYLVFQLLSCKQNLYIDGFPFLDVKNQVFFARKKDYITKKKKKDLIRLQIYDIETLEEKLASKDTFSDRNMLLITTLIQIKKAFSKKKQFEGLFEKYIHNEPSIKDYEGFIKDLHSIPSIAKEFENCSLNITINQGKLQYMNAEAHTQNVDINEREKRLGKYRKIEENVSDDKPVSLKITKKFKYE